MDTMFQLQLLTYILFQFSVVMSVKMYFLIRQQRDSSYYENVFIEDDSIVDRFVNKVTGAVVEVIVKIFLLWLLI